MAILTPAQLQSSNASTYTTNGANLITGANARNFNVDWISSSVLINANNNISGSQVISGSLRLIGNLTTTGSLTVTGSVNITEALRLQPQSPLPTGTVGSLAVSGSNLFFYNGAWTQVV
jgi:hypothetical protein